jgi:hypothetical protein
MKTTIAFVLACVLAACGGDKKDEAAAAPAKPPEPAPAPAKAPDKPAPPPAPTPAAGSGSATGSGSAAPAPAPMKPPEPAFDFDKLSHEDKMKFMKEKVLPPMRTAFQEFDAKKFKNFTCKTCHGKDPVKSKYKMPNAALPKLDFAALKAGKQAPKMAEFMVKTIKPQMAKILEQPEYTEANPKGFGCLECHEVKK